MTDRYLTAHALATVLAGLGILIGVWSGLPIWANVIVAGCLFVQGMIVHRLGLSNMWNLLREEQAHFIPVLGIFVGPALWSFGDTVSAYETLMMLIFLMLVPTTAFGLVNLASVRSLVGFGVVSPLFLTESVINSFSDMARQDPELFGVVGGIMITLGAYNIVTRLIGKAVLEPVSTLPVARGVLSSRASDKSFTHHDLAIISHHEAGHLLFSAVFDPLPEDIVARIERGEGRLGYVNLSSSMQINANNDLALESFNRWTMLMSLGGEQAEQMIFGETGDGATQDQREWYRNAVALLNRDEGFVWSNDLVTLPEHMNDELRQRLKDWLDTDRVKARSFLEANRQVLKDLAHQLSCKGHLGHDDIKPFMERVAVPDWMPEPQLDLSPRVA